MITRGAAVKQVVDARHAHRNRDRAQRHCRGRAHAGAQAWVRSCDDRDDRNRNEPAGEMIARRRAGLRLEEVVVDDVEANCAGREQEERVLASEGARQMSEQMDPSLWVECGGCGHGCLLDGVHSYWSAKTSG